MIKKVMASALVAVLMASSASAATITFDEFAYDNNNGAIPANRYLALGVTFVGTDDGSTWGGNSNGNPGNWGLQGTNGAGFSGFNGTSYTQTLTFAALINGFALDASRSNGSADGTILLQGFIGATLQSQVSVTLGAINSWSTASLTGSFDRVVYTGTGSGFHPFGIDNLRFDQAAQAVPEPGTWAMMLAGFGIVGGAMRRRQRTSLSFG